MSRCSNMAPAFSAFDVRDSAWVQPMRGCNFLELLSISDLLSNLQHVGLRQLGHPALFSPDNFFGRLPHIMISSYISAKPSNCVKHVLAASNPFEIAGLIVGSICILMIDFMTIWLGSDKCRRNQLMNKIFLLARLALKEYAHVSEGVHVRIQLFSAFMIFKRKIAPDISPTGNRIDTFPACNWFPNLVCGINLFSHDAGRLSGCRLIRAIMGVTTYNRSLFISTRKAKTQVNLKFKMARELYPEFRWRLFQDVKWEWIEK